MLRTLRSLIASSVQSTFSCLRERSRGLAFVVLLAASAVLLIAADLPAQESKYKIPPVYPPTLERPSVSISREALPKGAGGSLPTFDGESFQINFPPGSAQASSPDQVRGMTNQVLKALHWDRNPGELTMSQKVTLPAARSDEADKLMKRRQDEEKKGLTGKLGPLSKSTQSAINSRNQELRDQAARSEDVMVFEQRVNGVPIQGSGVRAIIRSGEGVVALTGRVFNQVKITNSRQLNEDSAVKAADAYVLRHTRLSPQNAPKPELVILPYGKTMLYAWREDVTAIEGTYRLWLDAGSGKVLELQPQFAPDSATGLVFNPDPNTGTTEQTFEVNAPSHNNYTLALTGKETFANSGADGVSSGNITVSSSGGNANFDVSPINGTTVDRTSSSGYNGQFQDVNAFSWVYNSTKNAEAWGSQTFPSMSVTVNATDACGFGINNSCGGGNQVTFGIGTATTSSSTSTSDLFNSAIDATVVVHEWAHNLSRLQIAVGGGTLNSALDEGHSDFWAATTFNNPLFGGWWAHNSSTPVQTGFVPRGADALDAFPSHRSLGGTDPHADGQIIDWALWQTRTGMNNLSVLGAFITDVDLIKAMASTGVGVLTGTAAKRVHDAFLDVLKQMTVQFGTNSDINKLLAGFAQAGIFLSERDAVIDISDDYLARSSATGPTFTIWTGRNYEFNSDESVSTTSNFNVRFTVDVANDAGFTTNHFSSGVQSGVVNSAAGVPTGTWTLPVSDWNALKSGDQLFYKVTTTDSSGGNARSSLSPGGGFISSVNVPNATINESGQCECTCSGAFAPPDQASFPWVMLFPIVVALFWRQRLKWV